MSFLEALILGLVQGLTEFLPVSSSGHLTIGQSLLNLNTSGADNLLFDIVVHAATVCSTVVIFWAIIVKLFKGTFFTTTWNEEKTYVAKIAVSMIPVFIIGIFFKDKIEAIFGSGLVVVGASLLFTALLLTFAYKAKPRQRESISYLHAFIIGLGQAFAVLPGLSRSGTTISAGLMLGNKKEKVAQFSFLMVLIPIAGQAILSLKDIMKDPSLLSNLGIMPLVVGFLGAFLSGLFACKVMINIVNKGKLIYFAYYCGIVGLITLVYSVAL